MRWWPLVISGCLPVEGVLRGGRSDPHACGPARFLSRRVAAWRSILAPRNFRRRRAAFARRNLGTIDHGDIMPPFRRWVNTAARGPSAITASRPDIRPRVPRPPQRGTHGQPAADQAHSLAALLYRHTGGTSGLCCVPERFRPGTAPGMVAVLAARRQDTTTASGHSACAAPKTRSARPA
jgi:hypothetical protein